MRERQRSFYYRSASDRLDKLGTEGGAADVMTIMSDISVQNWTMWSSVYDLTSGEYQIAYRRRYDIPYRGRIDMQPRNQMP